MNRSISLAAITTTVMAISMQASAGNKIEVSSAANDDWSNVVSKALQSKEPREAIQLAMVNLAQNVVVDGSSSPIDVSVILQARGVADSTGLGQLTKPGYNNNGVNYCYGNCHTACHGSRSWR
ncbi:hypothetical protein RYA05_04975 [Pseudomonas syringae pv. actinidiae]|nr:hypothetical protein [Pseudomonas syringae pv. actinidiae]